MRNYSPVKKVQGDTAEDLSNISDSCINANLLWVVKLHGYMDWWSTIYVRLSQTWSLNALKASWCCMTHCVINWQVIVLKYLSLPTNRYKLCHVYQCQVWKGKAIMVLWRWQWTQLFTVLLKMNVLGKCVWTEKLTSLAFIWEKVH